MAEQTQQKTFQRTYHVDHPGKRAATSQQIGGMATKLKADAKKEGLTLGEVRTVVAVRASGRFSKVIATANVEG